MSLFSICRKRTSIGRLSFKQDYHTHLLPSVDDSRLDVASSRQVILEMASRGVERIHLTPHIISGVYPNTAQSLRTAFDSFVEQAALPEDVSARLTLGAEYMVDEKCLQIVSHPDSIKDILKLPNNRVLIEMSYLEPSPQLDQVIFNLSIEGLTPVLAHPERYAYLYNDHTEFDRLAGLGVEFQLNILSTTGAYGKETIKSLEYILQRGYYKYVGTDLHSAHQYRTILTSEIETKIAKLGLACGLWTIQ